LNSARVDRTLLVPLSAMIGLHTDGRRAVNRILFLLRPKEQRVGPEAKSNPSPQTRPT